MSDLDPELRQLLAPIREATPESAGEPRRQPRPRGAGGHGRTARIDSSLAHGTTARIDSSPAHGTTARIDARTLAGGELSAAARERIVGSMREQVRGIPRARRRARIVSRVRISALFGAGLLACAALFGSPLTPAVDAVLARGRTLFDGRLAGPDDSALHIAATGVSPLSWTGSQGVTQELRGELDLRGDGELQVPLHASALLTTANGVRIDASERTRVRLRSAASTHAQGLALERGTVRCRVPPLGKGQSFVVSTATTRVVVHGTDFSVELGAEAGVDGQLPAGGSRDAHAARARAQAARASTSPCVRVREGLVEVQHAGAPSAWLGPGSAWGCEDRLASTVPARTVPVSPGAGPERTSKAPRHHASSLARAGSGFERRERSGAQASLVGRSLRAQLGSTHVTTPAASTLERENQLLAGALRAEQTGNQPRARKLLAALLAEYPHSPLAPEARAGLTRLRTPPRAD